MSKIIIAFIPCDRHSGSSFSQARGKLDYDLRARQQYIGNGEPSEKSFHQLQEVGRQLIRFVHSQWPHIASVIHESAVQHSDRQCIMAITACSQNRIVGSV